MPTLILEGRPVKRETHTYKVRCLSCTFEVAVGDEFVSGTLADGLAIGRARSFLHGHSESYPRHRVAMIRDTKNEFLESSYVDPSILERAGA